MTSNKNSMVERLASAPLAMKPESISAFLSGVYRLQTVLVDVDASPHEVFLRTSDNVPALPESRVPRLPRIDNAVAVIRVQGVLGQRRGSDFWADTFTEDVSEQLLAAEANPNIGAAVMTFDTPGGIAFGVPEAADVIRKVRESMPVYSLADPMSASAGFFLSSQATKAFVTRSGQVGSHGVFMGHMDISEALAKEGVKMTLVSAGKFKTERNRFEPLTDAARDEMQRVVNHHMGLFTEGLALGRGVSKQQAVEQFGGGHMIDAPDAVKSGMIDGVATLGELLAGIIKPRESRGRPRSLAASVEIEAEAGS